MARRRKGLRVDGWLVVDKPRGMTSARAVGRIRRVTGAAKLGHGGTLDPAATGVLPVALGEATKTIAFCQDASKDYAFTVRWGEATTTDDAEGEATAVSARRPTAEAIVKALPAFTGTIVQTPPVFSALKVGGRRAYDLARAGEAPDLEPRRVAIERLVLVATPDPDRASFETTCGKGTYVRALARDLARRLGTVGHVAALRRTRVGPFLERMAISVDELAGCVTSAPPSGALLPVETALDDIPALALTEAEANLLGRGRPVAAPGGARNGACLVRSGRRLVAIGEVGAGVLRPLRVFNLCEDGRPDVDHG